MIRAQTFSKTRIAPTPSGFLHLGNVLSFAVTAALARETSARIQLRIDDLDQERVEPQYVQDIFDTLNYLEIPWDEGPRDYSSFKSEYSQLHRMDLYRQALQELREQGKVFACDCSRAMIAKAGGVYPGTCRYRGLSFEQDNVSWRLCTEENRELTVHTLYGAPVKAALPPSMQAFVVRKKDGFPAYQLSSLVDDGYYGVDLVVRGADLWPSTLAQLYLSGLLPNNNFHRTTFHHHPLLLETADRKLSKSAGATSVQFLRKAGMQPADIYTEIARMLGRPEPARDFQELAALLINRH